MERVQFQKEYPLNNVSRTALWRAISMPNGLSEWFCDSVVVDRDTYVFTWKGFQQKATLIAKQEDEYIRFQWEEDKATKLFFEMSIAHLELTGMVGLVVKDITEADDIDDSIVLWDSMMERLKRRLGLN